MKLLKWKQIHDDEVIGLVNKFHLSGINETGD